MSKGSPICWQVAFSAQISFERRDAHPAARLGFIARQPFFGDCIFYLRNRFFRAILRQRDRPDQSPDVLSSLGFCLTSFFSFSLNRSSLSSVPSSLVASLKRSSWDLFASIGQMCNNFSVFERESPATAGLDRSASVQQMLVTQICQAGLLRADLSLRN